MSTPGAPPPHQTHGTLRDWARHNPHQIGYLRFVLFAAGLLVAASSACGGQIRLHRCLQTAGQCTYAAEQYDPPEFALYAVVSQTFQIQWTIQNTGSCHV
jgi:hypothetical protein